MIRIDRIDGIDDDSLALLEAAGFQTAVSLARTGPVALHRELSRANELLRIASAVPEVSRLRELIEAARKVSGINEAPAAKEASAAPALHQLLEAAPIAVPLSARMLVQKGVGIADVPMALPVDEIACHLGKDPVHESGPVKPSNGHVRLADNTTIKVQIDTSRVRSTEDYTDPSAPPFASPFAQSLDEDDHRKLLRAPRKESNEGRDPSSRRYLRGLLHTNPIRIYFGALVTLLMMMSLPAAMVSAFLLFASSYLPKFFLWVPSWLIAFPMILPIIALFYAVFGNICSCRVCCQKLFVHKPHLKSSRAHHIKVLGYILPLCIHIALFRWFRCTHCGTPIRLKE